MKILNLLSLVLVYILTNLTQCPQAQTIFKIGNLLPDFSSKNDSLFDLNNEITVTKALNFASQALEELFFDTYQCNFDINPSNTKCDVSYGTNSFFELVKDIKRTLLVFIGSCDSTIKPIAESVQFFNLTLLSYTETDPAFSDQSKYNGFYRLVPGEEQHNHLRLHLIKNYNWTRIGTVYLTKAKYNLAHNMLIRDMDKSVSVVTRSILENQTTEQYEAILKDFIQNDIKILIGIFDKSTKLKLFCQIYKNGMYGESYQWIILGSNEKNDFLNDYKNETECSLNELLVAFNGTLLTRVVEYSYEYDLEYSQRYYKNDMTTTNINKIEKEYDKIVKSYMFFYMKNVRDASIENGCRNAYFHGYAFDGLLTIFKVFSALIDNQKFNCSNKDFTRNIDWFDNLNKMLNKISFKGVTGHVSFKNASRIGEIMLKQLIVSQNTNNQNELKEILILVHDQIKNQFIEINDIIWHGNNPPRDQTIKIKLMYKIPNSMLIGASILATSGIILAICFLIFNIKFRQHRFIKMSSPNLNNLIIIGCLFSYLSIFFLNEHEILLKIKFFKYICVIRVWLLTIGFTLAFGAMFSKTYRVHAILTNATFTKKVIKDYKLFGLVVFLLVIEIIMLLSWQLLDPLHLENKPYDVKRVGEKMVFVENLVCQSNYMKIWLAALFSYKSLLILFGCFFAYETRHVTISALNDSKYIGISVYNVLIMCTAGSAISFIVHNKNSAFVLITLFIFACTTITLCLVFIPKIIQVRKDPIGKKKQRAKIFKKANDKRPGSIKYANTQELDSKINQLTQDNRNKENILEQINNKLEILLLKAKNLGTDWVQECLTILNTDDIEIQKVIEKLGLSKNDIFDVSHERRSSLTHLKKKISREKIDENEQTFHNSNNALDNQKQNDMCNETKKVVNKRKFNPPPQIVDLTELYDEHILNPNFSFKLDI